MSHSYVPNGVLTAYQVPYTIAQMFHWKNFTVTDETVKGVYHKQNQCTGSKSSQHPGFYA